MLFETSCFLLLFHNFKNRNLHRNRFFFSRTEPEPRPWRGNVKTSYSFSTENQAINDNITLFFLRMFYFTPNGNIISKTYGFRGRYSFRPVKHKRLFTIEGSILWWCILLLRDNAVWCFIKNVKKKNTYNYSGFVKK